MSRSRCVGEREDRGASRERPCVISRCPRSALHRSVLLVCVCTVLVRQCGGCVCVCVRACSFVVCLMHPRLTLFSPALSLTRLTRRMVRGSRGWPRNGRSERARAPRLPPANRHHVCHLQALVRAASFDHFDPDRRGLWVRQHADTHAQANSYRSRAHPGRMSAHPAAAAVAPHRSFGLKPRSSTGGLGRKPRWSTAGFGPKARRFPPTLLRAELSPQSSGRGRGRNHGGAGGRRPKVRGVKAPGRRDRTFADRKSWLLHSCTDTITTPGPPRPLIGPRSFLP